MPEPRQSEHCTLTSKVYPSTIHTEKPSRRVNRAKIVETVAILGPPSLWFTVDHHGTILPRLGHDL